MDDNKPIFNIIHTKCQECTDLMTVVRRIDDDDLFMIKHYRMKFTGKFWHTRCFFKMAKRDLGVVNPDEL